VRIRFDVLDEHFSAPLQATAKFGLETIYWQGLHEVLPIDLFYDQWEKFSVVPVFKKGSKYFFVESNVGQGVSGIQLGGDGDMTSALQKRIVYTPLGDISLATLEISDQLADRYITLRNKIWAAENVAQNEAVKALRESAVWSIIKNWFPNADEVFSATIDFSWAFLPEARKLINAAFPCDYHAFGNELAKTFQDDIANELSSLLYYETRLAYGRSLFFDSDIHNTIRELGTVSEDLYWTAVDACYSASRKAA
jgi:hypothetical protein